MQRSKFIRYGCAVLAAALILFCYTAPGQAVLDQLARWTGLTHFQDAAKQYPFSLHVIDVGKADALCVLTEDTAVLIDAGTAARGDDVADYLYRLGVKQLAAVFVTHPDDDHIGGLAEVLDRFPCAVCYTAPMPPELIPDTHSVRTAQSALEKHDIPIRELTAGEQVLYGAMTFDVLSPSGSYDSSNNQSLVLRLSYGEHRFLLMGDAEAAVEDDLLLSGIDLSADVLKVGHHGSNTSTSLAFLQAVSPRFAVISTGEDHNHLPRVPVLSRLDACEAVFRTDTDGTILLCSDGQELFVFTEK